MSLWGALGLVATGCARHGDEPSEVRRGALDPFDTGRIAGTLLWNGQAAAGLASQTLTVFIEGEQHVPVDPTSGGFTSSPFPPGNYFVGVVSTTCGSLPAPFARVPATIDPFGGDVSVGFVDITSAAKVIGRVTSNGVPLANPLISLEGNCLRLPSDAFGSFEGFLPPATYTGHVGSSSLAFTFDAVAGQTTDLRGGEPTPAGTDVTVELRGGPSQVTGVAVNFSQVVAGGRTGVPYFRSVAEPPPDGAFYIPGGHAWDVRTTASTSGPIRVCIHYDPNDAPPPESATTLRRFSATGGDLNVTSSLDTVHHIVCGLVTSLFPLTDTELDVGTVSTPPPADAGAADAGAADAGAADAGAGDAGAADAGADALAALAPIGSPCTTGTECTSGFCTDGVCCETECAGGPKDCQSCSIAAGGSADGTCTALPQCSDAPVPSCSGSTCPAITLPGANSTIDHLAITFPSPLGAGEVSERPCGAVAEPTNGYKILTNALAGGDELACLDLEVSSTYTGSVEVCVYYSDELLDNGMGGTRDPNTFELWHDDGSGFLPITTYRVDATTAHGPGICGNVETFSPFAIVAPVDTAAPVFGNLPPNPLVAYATSTAGATVDFAPTAIDAVDGPVPVSCTRAPGVFPVGTTPVTCTATDASHNTATASFTVWVQYQAPADGSFFLKPIRPDGSSVFKIGRAVPVKFALAGASAGITNLIARLSITQLSGNVSGKFACESDEDGEDTDFLFKYRTGKGIYGYRWKTSNRTKGTYELRADLGDGVVHKINVSLKAAR